jgi:hypothetical protein
VIGELKGTNPSVVMEIPAYKQLELRELDVSPCEQYSLGEMARKKMKYEN